MAGPDISVKLPTGVTPLRVCVHPWGVACLARKRAGSKPYTVRSWRLGPRKNGRTSTRAPRVHGSYATERAGIAALRRVDRAGRRPNARRWDRSKIQSLLFDCKTWTAKRAKSWAKKHGYRYGDSRMETTANYHRIRQAPPATFRVMRTITFGKGIKAVVGEPRQLSLVKPKRRKNPKGAGGYKLVSSAVRARERWTGNPADVIVRGRDTAVSKAPGGVLVDLGELHAVDYEEAKRADGPRTGIYRHHFGEEGGQRPRLTTDRYGRLRILGGDYTVESRGIVD